MVPCFTPEIRVFVIFFFGSGYAGSDVYINNFTIAPSIAEIIGRPRITIRLPSFGQSAEF